MAGEIKKKHEYFVDGQSYIAAQPMITGAAIKARLPEGKRDYALFLEGHGEHPDKLINDDTSVSLEGKTPKRFYTVPPATFGKA